LNMITAASKSLMRRCVWIIEGVTKRA
jgi:hypothetical protein